MASYLVKNKKSQATGIGQGQEAQHTGPLSAYGKPFFPFLKDSEINFWDKFQVRLGIWATGTISISLCSSPISGL